VAEGSVGVGQRVDFFVSYTGADVAWAEWAAHVLEAAGWTTLVQAWDFRPGSNFVLDMDDALARADRVLPLLSEGYLRSGFAASDRWILRQYSCDPNPRPHRPGPGHQGPSRPGPDMRVPPGPRRRPLRRLRLRSAGIRSRGFAPHRRCPPDRVNPRLAGYRERAMAFRSFRPNDLLGPMPAAYLPD